MIKWDKYFDKIYCIHFLPTRNERIQRIEDEVSRVGILSSNIFHWKYTYLSPFQNVLRNNIAIKHQNLKDNLGAFNCAFAHYEIYKEAIGLKLNRILILEEDISFIRDLDQLEQQLNYMPNTDVCLLDKFCYDPYKYQQDLTTSDLYLNEYFRFFDARCGNFGSAACYSLSLKAMNAFCNIQETQFHCADELWNNQGNEFINNHLTKSYAVTNLGYQKSFDTAVHDNIELAYKFINLNKALYQ